MTKNPPAQSAKPLPTPLAMSASEPSPSLLPRHPSKHNAGSQSQKSLHEEKNANSSRPHPKHDFPAPKLRLQVSDLSHPGSFIFLSNCNASTVLSSAVNSVLSTLYRPTKTNSHIPGTRSVTVILEPMGGVAYTKGTELDNDHKEIHFSLDYIKNHIAKERQEKEIQGVLVHEMVHCWQWNAKGTCPGGLIEGIADYVRLKVGLDPPHWKRPTRKKKKNGEDEPEVDQKWDAGYEKTGYFLEWLEEEYGEEKIRKINTSLQDTEYEEKKFWKEIFDHEIDELWKRYVKTWKEE